MGNKREFGAMANMEAEVLLGSTDDFAMSQSDIWIADSAARYIRPPIKKG
jgi:hypothetical protein